MRLLAIFLLAASLHAQITPAVDNTGRQALTNQLDAIAAQQTAARRATIAQIHTKQQAIARQQKIRARMIALLGGPWPEHSPLNPRITGASDHEGIHIERLLFDSQPNFPVTALLYLPQHTTKLPAILMAPGHSPAGKAGDAAFALAFAHRGFAVLSYDPIGQGERLQYPDPANPGHTLLKAPTGEHGEAGLQPTLIGDALARYFLIDAIRATDYLLTRPEIDPARIGAFGCSGGGLMTALTAALDTRIAVAGVACFTTSFDTLLPSIGPQDSEQSTPNFIASGLDFPDWSELFAPKPYAIIATTEDMFPFAGAQSTEKESRAFYTLFNASDNLAFITGPGHHGNLRPILPQILDFFTTHLHPIAPLTPTTTDGSSRPERSAVERPAAEAAARPAGPPPPALPPSDTQVTPTGQLATSYPQTETVYTLNLKRFAEKSSRIYPLKLAPDQRPVPTLLELQRTVRYVTHATASPQNRQAADCHCSSTSKKPSSGVFLDSKLVNEGDDSEVFAAQVKIQAKDGFIIPAFVVGHESPTAPRRAVLLVVPDLGVTSPNTPPAPELFAQMKSLAAQGNEVLAVAPRPSPPGTEETKSPVLGMFYLTELRAELTGNTLLGLRIDDLVAATDYLYSITDDRFRDPKKPTEITAEASGHMALVLLHAAILDPRLKHITLHNLPPTYTEYLHQPIPHDAPQDILPGVLLHYDTPDLLRALGSRVTVVP